MYNKKSLLILFLFVVGVLTVSVDVLTWFAVFSLITFTFHLIVRKYISFKPYFLSPYNLFSAKVHKEFIIDIPRDLVFHKLKESIEASKFKLTYDDPEKLQMLAISKTSWKSWGENIYFSLQESGNNDTLVVFDSAALFQIYTWGKNEDNYTKFINELEQSLTI